MTPAMLKILIYIILFNIFEKICKYLELENLEAVCDISMIILSIIMVLKYIKVLPMLG